MIALRSLLALAAAKTVIAVCDTSIIAHDGHTIGEEVIYEDRECCSLMET